MGQWFDDYLDRARVRFVALAILVVGLLMLVVNFATSARGRTFFGPALGADFGGFYAAGTILNSSQRDRLYDLDYHNQIHHEVLPNLDPSERLPFRYPPFVAVAFRPLALLPYETAFALWSVVSLGLYLGGLALAWKTRTNLPATEMPMVLLLALSFEPFLMECWLGGQLSAFAFFCVALAHFFQERQRPFAAGLALGWLAYKPTLLLLLGPMLLVGRRWRTLGGMAAMVPALAALAYGLVGETLCRDSLTHLVGFLRSKTTAETLPESVLHVLLTKYVDGNAFLRLLPGLPPLAKMAIAWIVAIGALWFLLPAWWQLERFGNAHRRLVWAATVIWTLVLNIYVGIYDVTLAVFAVLVTADVSWQSPGELPRGFRVLLVLLYVTPWFNQPLALATGVQAMTLVLMGMGVFLLKQARQATYGKPNFSDSGRT